MMDDDPLDGVLRRVRTSTTDKSALRDLVKLLWPSVAAVVIRRLRVLDRAVSDDATQETLIRVLSSRGMQEIDDPSAFRAYVWKIADNVARDFARGVLKTRSAEIALPGDESPLADERQEQAHGRSEFLYDIEKYRQALTDQERRLLDLMIMELSAQEIASRLGISHSAVGVRCFRLRNKLRQLREKQKSD